MTRVGLAVAAIGAVAWQVGCGGQPAQGGARQSCYPNGTCNAGLTCLSTVCVDAGGDAAAGASGAAGSSGAGGSSGAAGSAAGTGAAGGGGAGTGGAGKGAPPALRIISVDFVGGRLATDGVPMGPDEIAGVKPASHWNSAVGGVGELAALVFSDGVASGASVMWNSTPAGLDVGTYSIGYTDMPGDVRMMNGFLGPSRQTVPAEGLTLLTVSDLPAPMASGSYDVYVYTLGSPAAMRSYQYSIGNTAFTVVQSTGMGAPPPPPTPYPYVVAPDMGMGNYIIFRGVTGSSFSLTVKPGIGATMTSSRAPVNGFQIVSPSGS